MHRDTTPVSHFLAASLRVLALALLLIAPIATTPAAAQSHSRAEIELLAEYYADYYDIPLSLLRRVINRESTFNPSARNGPYYGLMQILPATARTMGYSGPAEGLLNAETNLIYAGRYLRGAWLLSGGSEDRAVQLYAAGYYYAARDAGMLEQVGLRSGPNNPPLPAAVGVDNAVVAMAPEPAPQASGGSRTLMDLFNGNRNQQAAAPAPAPVPPPAAAPAPAFEPGPVIVAAVDPAAAELVAIEEEIEEEIVAVALGMLPPARPAGIGLVAEPEVIVADAEAEELDVTAVAAVEAVAAVVPTPPLATGADALMALAEVAAPAAESDPTIAELGLGLEWASAYAELRPAFTLDAEENVLDATFAMLMPMQEMMEQAGLVAGAEGFLPPTRPDNL